MEIAREVKKFGSIAYCLNAIRKMLTHANDKYGAPEVGLFMDNTGWHAYYKGGSINPDGYMPDECFKEAEDAVIALYEHVWKTTNW